MRTLGDLPLHLNLPFNHACAEDRPTGLSVEWEDAILIVMSYHNFAAAWSR